MADRRTYTQSFKEEAVQLASETSVAKAANSLGISEYTLRNWITNVKHRPDNPFIGSGRKYTPAQDVDRATLLKEIKELKRANEILKEALGFFAKSQKK